MSISNSVDGARLRSYVERVESIQTHIDERNADKSEIYKEAKAYGYNPKIIKKVVSLRRQDPDKRREEDEILDLYLSALGD